MIKIMLDTMSGLLHGFDDDELKQSASGDSYTKEQIDRKLAAINEALGQAAQFIEVTAPEKLPTTNIGKGSVGVIKTLISTGKYERTAYEWDGAKWMALSGNYTADNVYFKEDIQLAGAYTSVGNVKLSDKVIPATGKSLKDVFGMIFDMTVQPTLGAAPTCSIWLKQAGDYEVGTTLTPSYAASFKQGKYNTPWNSGTVDDETAATGWSVSDTSGHKASTQSGSFEAYTVTDNNHYFVSAVANYGAGGVAKDNKNNDSSPAIQRTAGSTALSSSGWITAYRNLYIGSIASDDEITESVIKGLKAFKCGSLTKTLKTSGGDIPLVAGAVKVIVAIPTGSGKSSCGGQKLTEVLLASASNTPITSDYKNIGVVSVSGKVAGENMKDYDVYVYQPASIDAGEVHTIKIS